MQHPSFSKDSHVGKLPFGITIPLTWMPTTADLTHQCATPTTNNLPRIEWTRADHSHRANNRWENWGLDICSSYSPISKKMMEFDFIFISQVHFQGRPTERQTTETEQWNTTACHLQLTRETNTILISYSSYWIMNLPFVGLQNRLEADSHQQQKATGQWC